MAGRDPQVRHEKLLALHELWLARCRGNSIPDRSDFIAEEFQSWFGNIAIAARAQRPGGETGWRLKLVGSNIVTYLAEDTTGRFIEDVVHPAIHEQYLAPYREILRTRAPFYDIIGHCLPNSSPCVMHRLVLPLTAGGTDIAKAIIGIYFDPVPEDGRAPFRDGMWAALRQKNLEAGKGRS